MSHQVAEKWFATTEKEVIEAFESIRDRFLAFTARGYFAQVMQREHHHRCYRKWQETFELQRIYDEVREEVREMFEWLYLNRAKRIEQAAKEQAKLFEQEAKEAARREKEAKQRDTRVSLFALLVALGIGIPTLVTGFFGMNIAQSELNLGLLTAIMWFFGAAITSVSVALSIYFYLNRRESSRENKVFEVARQQKSDVDNDDSGKRKAGVVMRSYGRKIN